MKSIEKNKEEQLNSLNEVETENRSVLESDQDLGYVEAHQLHFLITSGCDVIATTLQNLALFILRSSIFQMMMGGIMIATCTLSMIFLKKYPQNYNVFGLFTVLIGLILVGLANFQSVKEEDSIIGYGILFLTISYLFAGVQFIYQELLLTKYKTNPLRLIAWEGVFGVSIFAVLLITFEFIECTGSWKEKICTPLPNGKYYVESTTFAIQQIILKWQMIVMVILNTITLAGVNYFGASITKYSTSTTRSLMAQSKSLVVWLFFLIWPFSESGKEEFISLQLFGFVIIIIGQLIYNKVLVLNFCGLDKSYKEDISSKAQLDYLSINAYVDNHK